MKCTNCLKISSKLNIGLDDNHFTKDRGYPVYRNELKKKRLDDLTTKGSECPLYKYTINIAETYLTKDIDEQEITLQGYDNIGSVSRFSRTGGIIAYCKKNWNVNRFIERTDDLKYWILFSKAVHNDNNHNILIGVVYRSPSYSEVVVCDIFGEVIEEICDKKCDILIAGDFNKDAKNSFYKNIIKNTLNDNGLKQIVNESARLTRNLSTINGLRNN